jgi:hypothetical protein
MTEREDVSGVEPDTKHHQDFIEAAADVLVIFGRHFVRGVRNLGQECIGR